MSCINASRQCQCLGWFLGLPAERLLVSLPSLLVPVSFGKAGLHGLVAKVLLWPRLNEEHHKQLAKCCRICDVDVRSWHMSFPVLTSCLWRACWPLQNHTVSQCRCILARQESKCLSLWFPSGHTFYSAFTSKRQPAVLTSTCTICERLFQSGQKGRNITVI